MTFQKNILNFLFFLPVLLLLSCNKSNSTHSTIGSANNIKPEKLDNVYVVNNELLSKKGLPKTNFKIEYSNRDSVSFPDNQRDYINIKSYNGSMIFEELTIGNTNLKLKDKELVISLLNEIADNIKSQSSSFELEFIEETLFYGNKTYMLFGNIDYSSYSQLGYSGEYRIMIFIQMPLINEAYNAVVISFLAHKDLHISDYKDFESKGMMHRVWQTFRYLE